MEAVKTGLSKTKLLLKGALSNIELPRRALTTVAGPTEARHQGGVFPKKNCCRNDIQLYRSGPLPKQSRRAPSEKKLLLTGRAHDRIQLPERASTEAVKTDPLKKETDSKAGPRQYPTTGAGPT